MSTFRYLVGIFALLALLGIILRYGNSSHLLAGDLNSLIGTITLQGNIPYYGPGAKQ